MLYESEVKINAPLDLVWEKFMDPEFVKKWQTGFKSLKHLEGELGMPGSKSEMVYDEDGRQIVMQEEITAREDKKMMKMVYSTPGVVNRMENYFSEADGVTTWKTVNEFQFTLFR